MKHLKAFENFQSQTILYQDEGIDVEFFSVCEKLDVKKFILQRPKGGEFLEIKISILDDSGFQKRLDVETVGFLGDDGFIYDKNKTTKLASIGELLDWDDDYDDKMLEQFEEQAPIYGLKNEEIGIIGHQFQGGERAIVYHFDSEYLNKSIFFNNVSNDFIEKLNKRRENSGDEND